jgi:hypothetical protein
MRLTVAAAVKKKVEKQKNRPVGQLQQHHSNTADQQRLDYLIALMKVASAQAKRAARKSVGAGPHMHARIQKALEETGGFTSAPRLQKRRVYDEAMLEDAWELFINEHEWLSAQDTFKKFQEREIVPQGSNQKRFLAAFRQHVQNKGLQLHTQYRGTVFYTSPDDAGHRAAFAASMLAHLRSMKGRFAKWDKVLNGFIWSDEVTLEEATHPKGAHVWHVHQPVHPQLHC